MLINRTFALDTKRVVDVVIVNFDEVSSCEIGEVILINTMNIINRDLY